MIPPLVLELLALPLAPKFGCKDNVNMSAVFATPLSADVTYLNDLRSWGTDCADELFRVGFCVRDETCARIHERVLEPRTADFGACSIPPGPRRYNNIFIATSFTASLNQNWYIATVPIVIALVLGLLWMGLSVLWPRVSPVILAAFGSASLLAMYIGWSAGMTGKVNNYSVIIYAILVALFALGTWTNQNRTGQILKLGSFIMRGNAIDGVDDGITERSAVSITAPASVPAVIQAIQSAVFLIFVASAGYIVEFASTFDDVPIFVTADRWYRYLAGTVSSLTLGLVDPHVDTPAYEQAKSLLCNFSAILPLNSGVIAFCVFYPFMSIFCQFATKFVVSCAVADWYTSGTKRYRPLPSGIESAGRLGLGRALWKAGDKVMVNGLWSMIGSTSASVMSSAIALIAHLVVSPIDCVVYSFIGFLLTAFTKFESRFGLVHASMYGGTPPTMSECSQASSLLVRRTFGRQFASVGDSGEVRLLSISGNALAVACGLIGWVGLDYLQQFDSVNHLGGWVILIIWLTGSAIQKPGFVVMIATLVDSQATWNMNLEDQMAKNAVMGFIIMSAVCNSVLRAIIEIPTSATDAVVYCYAVEQTRRRKIRSLKLDEMIHVDYVGDFGKYPAGTCLERIIVMCPAHGRGGESMTIDVDGETHEVKIPLGAKPGRDFEVAIPIPMNNLDESDEEDDSMYDYESEESEEYAVIGAIVNQRAPATDTMVQHPRS